MNTKKFRDKAGKDHKVRLCRWTQFRVRLTPFHALGLICFGG